MNRAIILCFIISIGLSSVEVFWDLGVSITDFSFKDQPQNIEPSTIYRVEGIKKYYNHDYKSAIYNFSKLNSYDQKAVLYEYLDSFYLLNQPSEAMQILAEYTNSELSDNVIYLKSKIYIKLGQYNKALSDLNYLIKHYPESDYVNILRFDIEKINLLKNE